MSVENDDWEARLQARLGRELHSQLDGQLGRAAPYFLARCDTPKPHRSRRRSLLGLAAIAAACCAAFIAWRQLRPPAAPFVKKTVVLAAHEAPRDRAPPVHADRAPANEFHRRERSSTTIPPDIDQKHPSIVSGTAGGQPLVLERALSSRTLNEGTLLVGNTPVRKVRRQWLERVEWFDPRNGARVQRIVPREEVLFVPLPIN